MYLGNLAHTSYAPAETQFHAAAVTGFAPLWRTSVGATISAAPTVVNGVVYVGAWDGNFYALDALTGATLWTAFVGVAPAPPDNSCMPGIGVSSQAAVADDVVYVGGGDSRVYALDRHTGAIRWTVPLADPNSGAFIWSSVMLSGNSLYVGIASLGDCPVVRGGLARIPLADPSHPATRYLAPQGAVGAGVWSTPAIDEKAGLIYVTTGNSDGQDANRDVWGSALLALDAATLQVRAYFFMPIPKDDADADFGSSPMLFSTPDGQQFVAANGKDGVMYVLRRPDLSLAWESKIALDCIDPELGCGSVSTPAFDGATLYTGAGTSDAEGGSPGQVFAFDPVSRQLLWSYSARGVVIAPVTTVPGLVFAPTTAGLVVLDATTGLELWSDPASETYLSQAAISDSVVYTTSAEGSVAAWKAITSTADRRKAHR
jgi:polyvinyl alcohol dehydrogenase (cytochrome)